MKRIKKLEHLTLEEANNHKIKDAPEDKLLTHGMPIKTRMMNP